MDAATIVRVIALVCAGMLAGIFFGHRMGAYYALQKLSSSSFVQFQQVVHAHYVRFMPFLLISALLSDLAWLFMARSHRSSGEFWLVAASACGIALIAAMTRAVNVPLNNQLMTWDAAAPPADVRVIWEPWDRVNTIRTVVSAGVLILEAVAANLRV
jgi:uncharacterized membrane protein